MPAKELHVSNVTSAYTEGGYKMQPCLPGGSGGGVTIIRKLLVCAQKLPQCCLPEGPQEKFLPGLSTKKSFPSTKDLAL